jgi:hypothetical protein
MLRWKAEERALHGVHVVSFGCWLQGSCGVERGVPRGRHHPPQRERLRKERFGHAADAAGVGFLCRVC